MHLKKKLNNLNGLGLTPLPPITFLQNPVRGTWNPLLCPPLKESIVSILVFSINVSYSNSITAQTVRKPCPACIDKVYIDGTCELRKSIDKLLNSQNFSAPPVLYLLNLMGFFFFILHTNSIAAVTDLFCNPRGRTSFLHQYSVMQSDGNGFYGDVVSDSFN